jgi:hypothetical protein
MYLFVVWFVYVPIVLLNIIMLIIYLKQIRSK